MGMRVSCLQDNLSYGLSIVSRAVASRSTLPIFSNVLLATDNGRLRLAATNREMGITCWIGASIEDDGELTVPARTLTDLVNTLSPERVDLEVDVHTHTLHLKCGATQANIKGLDATDFPMQPEPHDDDMVIQIPADEFSHTIRMVALAAATDDSRPVLTGVLMSYLDGYLTLAAADGFRLSVRSIEIADGADESFNLIVPAKVLREIERIITDDDELITMVVGRGPRSQAVFHLNNVEVFTQTIDGTFPDYNQIIPQSISTETVLDTSDMLRACRRADIFAREASHMVRLSIEPQDGMAGLVRVNAKSNETGDNEGILDAAITGESVEVAFNVRYLIDILGVIHSERFLLGTSQSDKPGLIRAEGDESFTHVVMPMQINR